MRDLSGPVRPRLLSPWANRLATVLAACLAVHNAFAQPTSQPAPATDLNSLIRATMSTDKPIVQAGRPIWIDFNLANQTENRLTLRIPEMSVDATEYSEMGLPIEHIFSGLGFAGPILEDEYGERHDSKLRVKPREKVPAVKLAPHGTVGHRLDLTRHYESMLRPGKYKLTWQPYNASITSQPLFITVLAERQAVILTDQGKITMRFYYEQAPRHAKNFIELVEQRFYDNLTFNRIVAGGLVQGGDPQGNRRGIRPDGKRLKGEFNSIPFEMGTVGMCRSTQDPDSASCQFFICLSRQPSFDGRQTAFGYIIGDESFETLRRIAAVPTEKHQGLDDYPRKPVFIRAVSLENVLTRQQAARPLVPSSQPEISITPSSTGTPWPRQGELGGVTRVGGTTVLPADASNSGSNGSSASLKASSDGGKPLADLPGLKARGRIGKRSTTSTRPAERQ